MSEQLRAMRRVLAVKFWLQQQHIVLASLPDDKTRMWWKLNLADNPYSMTDEMFQHIFNLYEKHNSK